MRALVLGLILLALAAATLPLTLRDRLGAEGGGYLWDFESAADLEGWQTLNAELAVAEGKGTDSSGAAAISIVAPPQLNLANGEIRHALTVVPGASYGFGGQYVSQTGDVVRVNLSVEVRDASQALIQTEDAGFLFLPGSWDQAFIASCDAVGGQFRVLVRGAPESVAYLDNLSLKRGPVTTPCPTPVPTATQTPTATPTATASSTPSPTATATHSPDPTATASEPATSTPIATASPTSTDAPPAASSTPLPTDTPPPALPGLKFRNGGFEEGEDGRPAAWETVGGLLMQSGSPARSGSWSGALFSATSSTKWAYQTVAVEPANWYRLDAYVYHNDPWVEAALLRVSWYASADGGGSQIATADSTAELTSPEPGYRLLTTGPVMAPPGARSAKLRVLLRPRDATNAVIYIDDVAFAKSTPPATPTVPSPTPTAAATSTPPPSATPASPADTPLPTSTPTRTPTPAPESTATPRPVASSTVQPPADIPTPTPNQEPAVAGDLTNGGFETAIGGRPAGWKTFGGLLTQAASPVRSGAGAGAFFSASASTKWLYQTVTVGPTRWYQLDAYVYHDHPWVEEALLRVSWYATPDGSGSAVASVDSTDSLTEPEPRYRPLSTGPIQAPPGVGSAKLRILLRPRDATSALIYIDDVSFREVAAPPFVAEPAPVDQPATSGLTSEVLSTSQPAAPSSSNQRPATSDQRPSPTPMPAPVIRRNTLRTQDQLATPDESHALWSWALLGVVAGAGATGWGAYLATRRQTPSEAPISSRRMS